MSAALLALVWLAFVLAAARRFRPPPRRVRALLAAVEGPPPPGPDRPGPGDPLAAVGRAVAAAVGRSPPGPEGARRLGGAAVAAVLAVPMAPWLAPALAAGAWWVPAVRVRRAERHRRDALVADLPEVVDLLVLAVGAGLNVAHAVEAVGRRGSGPVARALAEGREAAGRGRRLADALDDLPARLGEPVRPLVAALTASDRYGAPLAHGLARLADDVRRARRRQAEEAARRLPVALLFPLVLCTLPAFALLTLAPLVAGALQALRL